MGWVAGVIMGWVAGVVMGWVTWIWVGFLGVSTGYIFRLLGWWLNGPSGNPSSMVGLVMDNWGWLDSGNLIVMTSVELKIISKHHLTNPVSHSDVESILLHIKDERALWIPPSRGNHLIRPLNCQSG